LIGESVEHVDDNDKF